MPRTHARGRSGLVRIAALATACVFTVVAGCARAVSPPDQHSAVEGADESIAVRVVNHNMLDVTVYLVHDGTRLRLGLATAATTTDFAARTRSLGSGEFTLLADPIGATRSTSSETLRVAQGSRFTWTLESDFSRNSILVQ